MVVMQGVIYFPIVEDKRFVHGIYLPATANLGIKWVLF